MIAIDAGKCGGNRTKPTQSVVMYRTLHAILFVGLLIVLLFMTRLPLPFTTDDLFRDCLEETFIFPFINLAYVLLGSNLSLSTTHYINN